MRSDGRPANRITMSAATPGQGRRENRQAISRRWLTRPLADNTFPPVVTSLVSLRHLKDVPRWRANLCVQILHPRHKLSFFVIAIHTTTHTSLGIYKTNLVS